MSGPIESYGLIGDCETAALVGRDGSIDWLCWPRFDSDSVFGALLGDRTNGRWLIGPKAGGEATARWYENGTAVLVSRFETGEGAVELTDFMPLQGTTSDIVRLVRGVRGRVQMRMELILRFGYGAVVPWVRNADGPQGTRLVAVAGPDMVTLATPVDTRGVDQTTVSEFEVAEGQEIPFVLSWGRSYLKAPEPVDPAQVLDSTRAHWRRWSECCDRTIGVREALGDAAGDAVVRSLITLKSLTYAPTGGIVAAPTTSLPEEPGGQRNWDYRFCWLRDATMTLIALMDAGYYDEAKAWRDWLLRAAAGRPDQIQIMYGIAGERRLSEWEVPWLSGYGGARPVRVGNAAHAQLQIDVFGEVMDAFYQARTGGLGKDEAAWALQRALVEHLEKIWQEPDEGIWEIRTERRHFSYSKVMAWVAVDRCIRSVESFGLSGPVDRWRRLRARIHDDVCANGYDKARGSFVQAYGTHDLDASLLLIPAVGFLPAADPRFQGTVSAIERELMVDGLVRRYDPSRAEDGVAGEEGSFLACSFWLADAYVMLGRAEEGRDLFHRLLGLRNDLGLMSEQYDPVARRMLGNFPQAFSHVALVGTASRLARHKGDERTSRPAPPEDVR